MNNHKHDHRHLDRDEHGRVHSNNHGHVSNKLFPRACDSPNPGNDELYFDHAGANTDCCVSMRRSLHQRRRTVPAYHDWRMLKVRNNRGWRGCLQAGV